MSFVFLSCFLSVFAAESGLLVSDTFEGTMAEKWLPAQDQASWSSEKAHSGERSLSVTGSGSDEETIYWSRTGIPWQAGDTYRLAFYVKASPDASGGTVVSGPSGVNRDFQPGTDWAQRSFVFTMPQNPSGRHLRLGTWQKRGTVWFDDVALRPVQPIHHQEHGLALGAGEQVQSVADVGSTYRFQADLRGEGSNSARVLWQHTAGFNSSRWTMGSGQEVIYRHVVGEHDQTSGHVEVQIGYYVRGICLVEASTDGEQWLPVGQLEGLETQRFDLPEALLPAREVFIRLRGEGDGANFQVYGYTHESLLAGDVPDMQGSTAYLEQTVASPDVDVQVQTLGELRPGGANNVVLDVAGLSGPTEARLELDGQVLATAQLSDGRSTLAYELAQAGAFEFALVIGDPQSPVFRAATQVQVPQLYAADYGYVLDASTGIWWAEGTHKVSRERPLPTRTSDQVSLSAARHEYEPVQLVLRPHELWQEVTVEAMPFRQEDAVIGTEHIAISLVDHVPVRVPTDAVGSVGHWPDPLPPVTEPFDVPADQNQPLWITVYVPREAVAGDYDGGIRITAGDWETTVPIALHVWDFTLPDETPVRSGFGFSMGNVRSYHQLDTDEEYREVVDKYLQNFAAHRISPYDAMALDPIRVEFDTELLKATLDFSDFDRSATRYLDDFGFTGFRLRLQGMGGGTFHSRRLGKIGPYEQGTPEYEKLFGSYIGQLEAHLAEKGWLEKAYVYWFDEPNPRDYEFVIDGMELIRRHAPGLTRLLTEQPESELAGHVEIWCPVTHHYNHERAEERRQEGDRFWWYVCTGPKEPYCTLFIDHYAVEMRLWLWQTWKYSVDGILVWQTNYWTSPTAFPTERQNPYEDGMGYRTGYGLPVGHISYWGNGDGRFLYPPKAAAYGEKSLDAPVSSIRWELLREGIEDYLYFWLLREQVDRLEGAGVDSPELQHARDLLDVPENIVTSMTKFTKDPQPIYAHREALARAIEELAQMRAD